MSVLQIKNRRISPSAKKKSFRFFSSKNKFCLAGRMATTKNKCCNWCVCVSVCVCVCQCDRAKTLRICLSFLRTLLCPCYTLTMTAIRKNYGDKMARCTRKHNSTLSLFIVNRLPFFRRTQSMLSQYEFYSSPFARRLYVRRL